MDWKNAFITQFVSIIFATLFAMVRIILGTWWSYNWLPVAVGLVNDNKPVAPHSLFAGVFLLISNTTMNALNYFWFYKIILQIRGSKKKNT